MTRVRYLQRELQTASVVSWTKLLHGPSQDNPSPEVMEPAFPGLLSFFTSLFAYIPAVVHRRQRSSSEQRGKPEVTFNIPSE